MSDVDRLSSSGLYPALPIADSQRDEHEPTNKRKPQAAHAGKPAPRPDPSEPRPPKSLIDEYA